MKINRTKQEAQNALRKQQRPAEEYGSEALNPRGAIAKGMEMSAKRAISLHRALAEMLKIQGSVRDLKYKPVTGHSEVTKHLKAALGTAYWRTPTWKYGWAWTVGHWLDGGLERGVRTNLANMPTENAERVRVLMREVNGLNVEQAKRGIAIYV